MEFASQSQSRFIPKGLSAAIHLKLVVPSVCHDLVISQKKARKVKAAVSSTVTTAPFLISCICIAPVPRSLV